MCRPCSKLLNSQSATLWGSERWKVALRSRKATTLELETLTLTSGTLKPWEQAVGIEGPRAISLPGLRSARPCGLYDTILYYTNILYYTIYYTICYTISYYTILYYTILYYTILYLTGVRRRCGQAADREAALPKRLAELETSSTSFDSNETYHGPRSTGACVKSAEGYGVIEFEISNSTTSTVFRQPLVSREDPSSHERASSRYLGPRGHHIVLYHILLCYCIIYIYIYII